MEIRLEREALYRAIWSTPLRKVAAEYGLSDTGLRKVCIALQVPMPPRGHWARKAAGQSVEQPSLPEAAGATTFVSRPPTRTPDQEFHTADDDRWFAERIAFDVRQRDSLIVSERPERWHPVVEKLLDVMVAREAELLKSRAASEHNRRGSEQRRRREPDFSGWLWESADDRGQLVFGSHHAFAVRVSIGRFRRALALLNAVALQVEARGYAVSHDREAGRIVLDARPGRLELRMSERLETRTRCEGGRLGERAKEYLVPTGALRMFVEAHLGSIREVSDHIGKPSSQGVALRLEERLPELLQLIYRQTVQARGRQRQNDAMHAQWAAESAERARVELRREDEKRRRERLLHDVRAWQQAQAIRAYAQVAESALGTRIAAHADWRTWALGFADELDPIRAMEE